jgi:hypothetical protein
MKQAGLGFAGAGAGVSFVPVDLLAISLGLKFSMTVPVVIPVLSPESLDRHGLLTWPRLATTETHAERAPRRLRAEAPERARRSRCSRRRSRRASVQPFFDVLIRHGGIPGPQARTSSSRARSAASWPSVAPRRSSSRPSCSRRSTSSSSASAWSRWPHAPARIKRAAAGVELLHDHADEIDADRRNVVTDALALLVEAKGDDVAIALARFTDGFLHATIALEALTRPGSLSRLSKPEPLFERFSEAFDLADSAPRSADRAQGVRELRRTLPAQLARTAGRFEDLTLAWFEERCTRDRPETREVLTETISRLRPVIGEPAADRLRAALSPRRRRLPRDPSRIVHGTRKRSRGR